FAGSLARPRTARRPAVRPPRAWMRTTDGVSVSPVARETIETVSPSNSATVELLVPRSMPTWMPDGAMCSPPADVADFRLSVCRQSRPPEVPGRRARPGAPGRRLQKPGQDEARHALHPRGANIRVGLVERLLGGPLHPLQ